MEWIPGSIFVIIVISVLLYIGNLIYMAKKRASENKKS